MNLYKKSDPFFQSLILHCLLALACSLFCSYSYSFPNSFYTIKHLLFNSLPNTWSWFVSPSCLFVVVNFIVVFLIGESRITGGNQSSYPEDQVYDEYVARTRSLRKRRPSTRVQVVKKEGEIVQAMDGPKEDNTNEIEDRKEFDDQLLLKEETDGQDEDFTECEENVIGNDNDEEEEQDEKEEMEEEHEQEEKKEMKEEHKQEEELKEEDEEEGVGMAAEELNRKVEDFIARVNKQRWLEARLLVCSTRD